MDAIRFASLAVIVLAIPLPGWSQAPKPSVTPQPYAQRSSDKTFGPLNINRNLNIDGIIGVLSEFEVLPNACCSEQIRVMPAEVKEPLGSNARLTRLSTMTQSASGGDAVRKTYALGEFGDDPSIGEWIAAKIPEFIQPGTWNKGEAQNKRALSYFAPAKILLVLHTAGAHAEIEELLQSVKKSLPQGRVASAARHPSDFASALMPAQFTAAPPTLSSESTPPPESYPVPAQRQQPKHLFHFIIRYEGDGVIDANIVEFMKAFPKDEPSPNPDDKSRAVDLTPTPAGAAPVYLTCPLPTSKKDVVLDEGTTLLGTPAPRRPVIVPLSPDVTREVAPPMGTPPPVPR